MYNPFTKHPRIHEETYLEHFKYAFKCGIKMIFAGIAFIIHAIFPWLFEYTGSNRVYDLAKKLSGKLNSSKKPISMKDSDIKN
ncbi:MAG: DUF6356 family protein [Gammaproteobacteria bacterium]